MDVPALFYFLNIINSIALVTDKTLNNESLFTTGNDELKFNILKEHVFVVLELPMWV